MKVLKPDDLSLLHRSFTLAGRHHLSLGMLAMFPFAEGGTLALEGALWPAAESALAAIKIGAPLDEGWPKPASEFMVCGTAFAPAGTPVGQLSVRVTLGGISKELYVFGDRSFGIGGFPSKPVPFMRMPIGPAQSFGGPGWTDNPEGKGYADVQGVRPLPNVESPRQMMAAVGDRPTVGGFAMLPAMYSERMRHLGQFDDRWLKEEWPNLPSDTRLEHFMAAPSDQRLRGYLRGDERFALDNMHPSQAHLEGRLPGLRARCFIQRNVAAGTAEFVELETRAETVWLFPDLECGIVLHRAVAHSSDSDAEDITHAMLEWERLAEPALPLSHYERIFRERIAQVAAVAPQEFFEPLMAGEVPAAAPAMAPGAANVVAAAAASVATPELAELEKMTADMQEQIRALLKEHGLTSADIMRPPTELPDVSDADIEAMTQEMREQTKALLNEHGLTEADVIKPPTEPPPISGEQLEAQTAAVKEETKAFLDKHGVSERQVQAHLEANPATQDAAQIMRESPAALAAEKATLESMLAKSIPVPAMPQLSALGAFALPEPVAEPVRFTREDVMACHQRGESLAGLDLTGLDLSELDFSGVDFSHALLSGVSFKKSVLIKATLEGALLHEADFGDADLSGASLSDASAAQAVFTKAQMTKAKLTRIDLSGSDLAGVDLSAADLSGALFNGGNLAGVSAIGCRAEQASFDDCELTGADFSGSMLAGASFGTAQGKGIRFTGSVCDRADFHGAQMEGVDFAATSLQASRAGVGSNFDGGNFAKAQMSRASWEGASAKAARFEQAMMDNADLSRLQAQDAVFTGASAQGAKLGKADLTGADLTSVNLLKGSLRKAKLERAVLHHANLYGVDFEETKTTRAALEGADIGQTLFAFRPLA